jgi:hypothetical protein
MRALLSLLLLVCSAAYAQSSAGLLGVVRDANGAVAPQVRVTARNLFTNLSYHTVTTEDGLYRLPLLPPGEYEVTLAKPGFRRHVNQPVRLQLGAQAELDFRLEVAAASEAVNVSAEAPLINTTSAEVGFNVDARRIGELPLAPNRNILSIALQAPGVSQLSSGNATFAAGGVAFSVNGMRTRSNNFMLDGADSNNPSVTGLVQEINNPDLVAEFRLITNQFLPEYGRAAGSVVNIITKSGTNQLHGTAYWSHNSNQLNARTNLDKRNFAAAPWRVENQFGATAGGPAIRDRTFLFGSLLRWTDRRFASGTSITGAPTEAGRAALETLVPGRPQVGKLLQFLPAAQEPTGQAIAVVAGGRTVSVPVGTLSGAAPNLQDVWQWSGRVDHRWNERHTLMGRALYDDRLSITGQAVPEGLTTLSPARRQAYNATMTSVLSPTLYNEMRVNWQRQASSATAADREAFEIPSIEINQLGLTGFSAGEARTALGLAGNLPQALVTNNYQVANNFSVVRGAHAWKLGFDVRRAEQFQDFNPTLRGRLQYNNLQDFVDDVAQVQAINQLQPGLSRWQHYRHHDFFFFVQDEMRVNQRLRLTYGVRYESPGNPFMWLARENERIVAANGNNPGYRLDAGPSRDVNNWAPRLGFNLRLTDKTVLRGGYARTYDFAFNNILLNIYSAWPFTYVLQRPARSPQAFATIDGLRQGNPAPLPANLMSIPRTVLDETFRAPLAEQFSTQVQREFSGGYAVSVGHIATKGTALFQTVDANPTAPGTGGAARVDPSRGVMRLRANSGSSIYHALQASVEKRFTRGYQFAAHYTWSSFLDDQSEIFNASVAGEVALAQDAFNRRADRGRSAYDRPHRFSVNGIWELPWFANSNGIRHKIFYGWQAGGFLTFQSGAPFSPLNGADPGFRMAGIDALVGNPLRPNVATDLDISSQSMGQLFPVRGTLFQGLTAADSIGNAGRNILRADGINSVDLVLNRRFRLPFEGHVLNFRAEAYNLTNTRDFGIPNAIYNSAAFLNQWNTNGGGRRVVLMLRYQF